MLAMRLEFEAERHVYRVDGRQVPSVTQILEVIEDWSAVNPETLAAAAQFGQHVHEACALELRGELDRDALDTALVPYIDGLKRFLNETGVEVIVAEHRVFHHRYHYAGTLDAVVAWPGRARACLIDWKSGALPRSVGPQLAAYAHAYGDPSMARFCVQLMPNAYRVHRQADPTDWSLFLSCLNIWRHKHG